MIAMIFDDWNDGLGEFTWMDRMEGMWGWWIGGFRASPACEGGFETRPYVASLSLCEGEEGVLVWPAGGGRFWLVGGGGVPPLSFGHFPR